MEAFADMRIIRMKKEWEFNELENYRMCRFSSIGLTRYWKSIDLAVKHWDHFIAMKRFKKTFQSACLAKDAEDN